MRLSEQYRPVELSDIVGQPTDAIQRRLTGENTPNFLLYGPPGTGKTTAARCIAREVQYEKDGYVELNAADVGVDEVRSKVDRAGRRMTLSGSSPVIILDEMDVMGYKAQQSLKKRLEDYPAVFILLTNDTSLDGINRALVDRCKVMEFGPVDDHSVATRVTEVAQQEGINISGDDVEAIVSFANGSVRTALSRLADYKNNPQTEHGHRQSIDTDVDPSDL